MTGNEYQVLASRTINHELRDYQQVDHAVLGMNSEAGEIAGLYQKQFHGHMLDGEHVKKELGDLLRFVAEICTAYNWKYEEDEE